MIKVMLADDHAIFRNGLRSLLERNDFEVVAEAENASELKSNLKKTPCDLVICDCRMPGGGPVSTFIYIKEHFPHCKVVFLTGVESTLLFQQLVSLGVDGIALKKGDINDLIVVLKSVIDGESYIPKSVQEKLSEAETLLTAKEFQVLELILLGMSNPEIAKELKNSESTINTHRVKIMKKTYCKTVVELVHFARDSGLFDS